LTLLTFLSPLIEAFDSMTESQMFYFIYDKYTKHGMKVPSRTRIGMQGRRQHTENVKVATFIHDMREKLRNNSATPAQKLGCEKIKVYASSSAATAARVAQQSEGWTKENFNDFSASLTKFQKKLDAKGNGKCPVNPSGKNPLPFTEEEQKLGRRIALDLKLLRESSTIDNGLKARIEIYVKHDLVEFMPDWDKKASSSFTVAEMRAWNKAERIVVMAPVIKSTKRSLGKKRTPSNAGLLANSNRPRRSTREEAPVHDSSGRKRKSAVEGLSSNKRRSKHTIAPEQAEEEEFLQDELQEEHIVPGIINELNTCYAASALQLLFSSPSFIVGLSNTYISQTSLGKELPLTKAVLNVAKDIGLINEEGVVQSAVFTTVAVPSSVASNLNSLKVFLNDSMNGAASLLELKTIVDGIVGNFHDVVNPNDPPVEKDVYV
jgi:hypothetical protein